MLVQVHICGFALIILLSTTTASCFGQAIINPAYETEIERIIDKPVPLISCKQLSQKIASEEVVLFDARAADEYAISHLYKAQQIGYDSFQLASVANLPKNKTIVIYCSIGYRSEKIGEQLLSAGYTNVYNLYGGIFEWYNQSRPLFDSRGRSNSIHPYNESWGQWLKKGTKTKLKP